MINKTLDELVNFIRDKMRDERICNKLLGKQENTNTQIKNAIELALDDYNSELPEDSFTLENFTTFPSLKLLVDSTIIELLVSAGILYSRNRLPYNDGGVQVDANFKSTEYLNWITVLLKTVDSKKSKLKNNSNLQGGWGAVTSPYRAQNRYYY